MDIAAFLTDRYDEAEQRAVLARQVIGGQWDSWEVVAQQLHACCDTVPMVGRVGQLLQHDADPAHVLADIAAKRGLLEAHGAEDDCVKEVTWPDLGRIYWIDAGEPCPSLRWLAAPYAEHTDFNPAWRIGD